MASENKTVAEIAKEMRAKTFGEECCPDCGADFQRSNEWPKYADSIEAAHKREIIEAVKPIEANYEFMLKQFADKEDQYVRCRIELNDAIKNLDECKAELEKARENGKQMWLNALHNSTSKSELHQMLMQAVQEKYKEDLAAKDREIAGLREKMGDDDLLKMAKDLDEKNRKIAILEERVKIAKRAFEKIDAITKEAATAIIVGDACVSMTADDHAYKYLFEAEQEGRANEG